jgi:hypothetical protein
MNFSKVSYVLLLLSFLTGNAQDLSFAVQAGVIAGAPVPNRIDRDSSSGKIKAGPFAGMSVRYRLNDNWSVNAGVNYSMKGAMYSSLSRKDTLVEIEIIPGVKDTVPTFYTASVNGNMTLHYLEIPLQVKRKTGKAFYILAGISPGVLFSGSDTGSVDIVIGEGGFFDDTTLSFQNYPSIRKLGLSLEAGGGVCFAKDFFVEVCFTRGLIGLYRAGFFEGSGQEIKNLFHTQMRLSVGYSF